MNATDKAADSSVAEEAAAVVVVERRVSYKPPERNLPTVEEEESLD